MACRCSMPMCMNMHLQIQYNYALCMIRKLLENSFILTHYCWVGVVITNYHIRWVMLVLYWYGIDMPGYSSGAHVSKTLPFVRHLSSNQAFIPPSLAVTRYIGHSQPMMSLRSFFWYTSFKCCPPSNLFASLILCVCLSFYLWHRCRPASRFIDVIMCVCR